MFPTEMPLLPDNAEDMLTDASGALVPKDTIVRPINILDTLKLSVFGYEFRQG